MACGMIVEGLDSCALGYLRVPIGSSTIIEWAVGSISPDANESDTGPVLFPDLSVRREVWADYLSLAFLAYETRTDGHADFVIESPVPVGPNPGAPRVMHYDRHEHRPAINTIWQVTGSGAGSR